MPNFAMSFGDYNTRRSTLTSLDSFPAYTKQQNPSLMMYRGSQISGEMDYPVSPRMVTTRSARTPVLTTDDCPGLTEIKDVRIRNNLLEEIFNVEDSIELDYFELERQEANFDSYLSGCNSPSNTRLSLELRQDDSVRGRRMGCESNGYQLHELQNRRYCSKDPAVNVNQANGLSVKYEKSGHDLVAVASPTISSTCEGGLSTPVASGVGCIPSGSPGALAMSDTTSVHSTTNVAGGHDMIASADIKTVAVNKSQQCCEELPPVDEKTLPTVVEPVQGCGTRENVRPRPESRSHKNTTLQQVSGVSGSRAEDVSGDPVITLSSSGGLTAEGESTTASSSSTSPSQLHVTKRQRVIDCGSDLLAEVRQAYEYIQGADLYAPSSHPTFANLDVARVPSAFQPNTDQNGQQPMNFNFSGQTSSVPVAFVGNSQMGVGSRGSTPQQAGMPCIGIRSRSTAASPSVIYQSCPDLASPGRQQVPETVACSRFVQQRPLTDEATAASYSAPTTPSKRAGPWSANAQHVRSPMSPSLQGSVQWQAGGAVPREPRMSMQLNRQNMNSGQNMTTYDMQRSGYETNYDPYLQQFRPFGRPQSPLSGPGPGRSVIHNVDRSRSHYTQPPANSFAGITQISTPGGHVAMSDAVRMGDGAPLSQNAFLRSVVNDESLVFRSHPLFPLLRDIIIADMNFHTPSFPFQLIANLPSDFSRLVDNYMQRNPQLSSVKVSDPHAESVVMDALAYAHAALIGKIEARKMKENGVDHQRVSVSSGIEDFCETFERTVKPVVDEYTSTSGQAGSDGNIKCQYSVNQLSASAQFHTGAHRSLCNGSELSSSLPYGLNTPPPTLHLHQRQQQHAGGQLIQHCHSLPSSPHKLRTQLPVQSPLCSANIYHSGSFSDMSCNVPEKPTNRSKVLPKEAVALMTDWLRQHKDNPYPNDDEKEALIASTRLTMNQINYWFTNARRRLLPKWTLQRQIEEQDTKLQSQSTGHQQREDVIVL